MKNVLIIYKFLPQYRVDFFQKLKIALEQENICLELIYGKHKNADSLKNDEVDIDWGLFIPNKTIKIGNTQLIWQPCLSHLKNKDLVIVEQANKLLLNYYLMFARHFLRFKFAFWGHGKNMQDSSKSLRNKFKYVFLKKCDWWFSYTKGVKEFIRSEGYPEDKITVVQNAIDTANLRKLYCEVNETEVDSLRKDLNIYGNQVGIYCGGMYKEKRLDFIFEVCKRVKEYIPDFHMIFLGAGIESYKVREAEKEYPWIHYVGPMFGKDRVKYFKLSLIQMMPGSVGLGILDSFALETPIVTTEGPYHGPEIEYLENGVNGIITKDVISDYTNTVIDLIMYSKYSQLSEGCRKSTEIYSVEKMVTNFKDGILQCLQSLIR